MESEHPMSRWTICFDDGSARIVDSHYFREDGSYTVFQNAVPGHPIFAALTRRIVSIDRYPDRGNGVKESSGPEPDEPGQTTITVQGSVLPERDLRDALERQMRRFRHDQN